MHPRLRWGVLGVARIATTKVIPAVRASRWSEVIAIASRDLDRARAAAGELDIPRAYGSYEELLQDAEVDAIYLPLPNHLHVPWTIAAAQAGKHVLCEKPMALDASEARRAVAACEAAGVVFMEAFMYRLHPQWTLARDLVRAGRLGEVRTIHSGFSYRNLDPANIRNVAAYGGGALLDIGCYCIDLSRWLFDAEPEHVHGLVRTDPEFGTDVVASGLLSFPGERQALFSCSTISAPDQWVHVVGTEATLTIEVPFNAPPDRPTRVFVTSFGRASAAPETLVLPVVDQYALQADAFARAVFDGTPVPVPPENGIANLEVIAQLRR